MSELEDALKTTINALSEKIKGLEQEVENLVQKKEDAEEYSADLEGDKDEAEWAVKEAEGRHADTKRSLLDLLRKVEWSFQGLCPLCKFQQWGRPPRHADGCDLKLTIWRLDFELVRRDAK